MATCVVSRAAYEEKISTLEKYLNDIDSTLSSYETLRNDMAKFIDGSDDNYDNLRQNVEVNINAVKKAKKMTEESLNMLRKNLDDIEFFDKEVKGLIDEGIEFAKNKLESSFEGMLS